jgi:hypothetical protein
MITHSDWKRAAQLLQQIQSWSQKQMVPVEKLGVGESGRIPLKKALTVQCR